MYPRLQLLRELLRDDGAIFVSIGDDEISNLRMVMDEIFGSENFIATIIWRNSTGPKQTKHLSISHDYICLFAKNKTNWKRNLLPRTAEQEGDYTNPDNDPRGPWRSGGLDARNYYSKGRYAILCPGGRTIDGPPGGSYWRVSEDTLWELDGDKRIWWGEDGNNVPRIKRFLSEVQEGLIPQTFWDYAEVGHTQEAKQEYLQILDGLEVFTTPKPVALIKRILQISTSPGDWVLDSFAGSGTTGHAVLEVNREDADHRKFIMIQIPFDTKDNEKEHLNISEKITAERMRRVIEGYTYTKRQAKGKSKKQSVQGLGGSFSYARVGTALFGEYRDLGAKPPAFAELAKYVFYTETSREFDGRTINEKTGKIGEYKGTSYYLLYTPAGNHGRPLDLEWLKSLGKTEKNRQLVVYCEKLWVHREDLAKYEVETGRKIRPMVIPFNLK